MKYALSVLTMTMALSSGATFAVGVGETAPASVEITFASPSTISHNITPVGVMEAGQVPMDTVLANGIVNTGEVADIIQITFLSGTSVSASGAAVGRIITGEGGNQIQVSVYPDAAATSSAVYGNNALNIGYGTPRNSFSYLIKMGSNRGTHTVEPDTYTLQLGAQRWEA